MSNIPGSTIPPKWYYYATASNMIRIKAKYKPAVNKVPKSGTWVIQESTERGWIMPAFPEITWAALSKLEFITSEPTNNSKGE